MKLTYQKPAYRHIALDGTTPSSGCSATVNHTRSTCSVPFEDPFEGVMYNVFEGTGACDIDPGNVINQYGGDVNPNLFGS